MNTTSNELLESIHKDVVLHSEMIAAEMIKALFLLTELNVYKSDGVSYISMKAWGHHNDEAIQFVMTSPELDENFACRRMSVDELVDLTVENCKYHYVDDTPDNFDVNIARDKILKKAEIFEEIAQKLKKTADEIIGHK